MWGNALYVNLSIGESYVFMDREITLVENKNNFSIVDVGGRRVKLMVARRSLPEVVNGIRIFIADNRPVANLTDNENNKGVHAALSADALLCLSDPAKPLLDPVKFVFPISRDNGFTWTMAENSHMFAYLRPVRAHEGIDIDLSDARGWKKHALLAPEDGIIKEILYTGHSDVESRIFIQSASHPELTYTYSHVNRYSILVKKGERVHSGQPVGYIWGDGRWGHLHFALRNYDYNENEKVIYGGFNYLLNIFPQMYELYHGDLEPRRKTWNVGSFRFAGNYWIYGNRQHLDFFDPLVGYGWQLDDWCTHGRVETSCTDEGILPDQSARLSKIMHSNTTQPVTNPDNYFDFEVVVSNGKYIVNVRVGDMYTGTWQRLEIEGLDAGTFELDHSLRSTGEKRVEVNDGHLTVRIHLLDAFTPAGLNELHFSITGKNNYK